MSLQVWLPLNGDLHNQGLSGLTVTNSGATVNNNGKIGKCYQFGTAASDISLPATAMTSYTTECSVCFWLNILTWNTSYATFFQAGPASAPWSSYIFGLLRNNTASTCCFTISNGSSASNANYLTPAFDLNKWYHIALVYKTGHCLIYINGELYQDYTTSIVPNFSGITTIKLGRCTNGSSYQTNCLMNDFRIYDHALSAKEIEEISKGLILHYKLDNNSNQVLNNCYNYPTFNTSSPEGGWSHWNKSGGMGSRGQNTNKDFIFNKNNQYSHWISNPDTATAEFLLYQSPAFNGGFRSLTMIIKEEHGNIITESICFPAWNARNGGAKNNKWTSIENIGNDFYLCKVDGISQDGSNDLVGVYVCPGYKIYISEAYLENSKEQASDIFYFSNIIQDCSGYNYNGTIINGLNLSLNTPRYSASSIFDSTCYIDAGNQINNIKDEISFGCWAYNEDWATARGSNTYQSFFSSIEGGGIGWQLSGANLYCYTGTGTSSNTYYNVTIAASSLSSGWHHFFGTFNGYSVKFYLDGALIGTSATSSTKVPIYHKTNHLYIGAECSGTQPFGSNFFNGKISDVRIYATALSAEDIKELYNTSMSIDSNGNVHARELVEV